MKIEFDVQMTTSKMYDYMLRHMMTSFQGIVGEMIGILLVVGYFLTGKIIYIIAGVVVILYLPVTLYLKAKRQVALNPVFKEPLHYTLDEEGVKVKSRDAEESLPWSAMYKATSSLRTVILYTNKINACLFPKEDLGDNKDEVIKMISTHMDPKRVNIKGN